MKGFVVKVIQCSDQTAWYRNCINTMQRFHVIKFDKHPLLWFSTHLFFLPQDIEVVEDEESRNRALVPGYEFGQA